LPVGEAVRTALLAGAKLDAVRQAARKDGMKSLQEEGILMVIKGVTSLPELMRVMKQQPGNSV
jgi:type II secretory ATPase GspE/PulE/Tfp pilus assembly ATPase PilB-like protein